MPHMKGDVKRLCKMFEELGREFPNPERLSNKPEYMRVIRLMLGKSLDEMSELLGKKTATVAQYEAGRIKSIPAAEAKRYCNLLSPLMPKNFSREELIKNFNIFAERSKGGMDKGFMRAKKAFLTKQESDIEKLLKECGRMFKVHETVETDIGPLNFDFVIGNEIIVECTESTNKMKAESIGFRIMKIKARYPHMKFCVVVPSSSSNGVLRRLRDADFVIFDNEIGRLRSL